MPDRNDDRYQSVALWGNFDGITAADAPRGWARTEWGANKSARGMAMAMAMALGNSEPVPSPPRQRRALPRGGELNLCVIIELEQVGALRMRIRMR
jgi:hypothetical protein